MVNKSVSEHVKTLVKRNKSGYFQRIKDSCSDSSLGKKFTNLIQKFVSEVEILANFIESHESSFLDIVYKGLGLKQYQEIPDDEEEESYERNILLMAMILEQDISADSTRVYTKIEMIMKLCTSLNETVEKSGGYLFEKDCGDATNLEITNLNSRYLTHSLTHSITQSLTHITYLLRNSNLITTKAKNGNVTCGTVHSAKGMQWKAAILLRATNDLFDEWTEDNDHACINLLYVALSRPMQYLYITYLEGSSDEPRRDLSSLLKPLLNHRDLVISKQYVGAEATRSFDAQLALQLSKEEPSKKSLFQSASIILQSNTTKLPSKRQSDSAALDKRPAVTGKRQSCIEDHYPGNHYTPTCAQDAINFIFHKHPMK